MGKALYDLFEEWEKKSKFKLKGQRGQFIPDGIVCPEIYEETHPKVLFVLKDANDANPEIVYPRGICDEVLESNNSGATWNRIAEWVRALVYENNEFIGANDLKKESGAIQNEKDGMRKYFKHIAILNLKKASGIGSADPKEIEQYAEEDRRDIIEEIKICNPDVIIACSKDVFLPLKEIVFENKCAIKGKINLNEKMKDYGNYFDIKSFLNSNKALFVLEYRHPNDRGKGSCTAEEHYQNMLRIRDFLNEEMFS